MQTQEKIGLHKQVALVLVCAIAYFYAFKLNLYWFDFKISVMFSIISATLHQIWFYWQGVTDNLLH